jgi:hypothetical protein
MAQGEVLGGTYCTDFCTQPQVMSEPDLSLPMKRFTGHPGVAFQAGHSPVWRGRAQVPRRYRILEPVLVRFQHVNMTSGSHLCWNPVQI